MADCEELHEEEDNKLQEKGDIAKEEQKGIEEAMSDQKELKIAEGNHQQGQPVENEVKRVVDDQFKGIDKDKVQVEDHSRAERKEVKVDSENEDQLKNRNDIINNYIANLENKGKTIKEVKNDDLQLDEEDEFEKAEATYKKSISSQKEQDKKDYPILHYHKLTALKLVSSPKEKSASPKSKSPPGYLYQKENEYLLKQQSFRRIQSKEIDNLHHYKYSALNNNRSSNHQERSSNDKSSNEKGTNETSSPPIPTSNPRNLKAISRKSQLSHMKDSQPHFNPEVLYSNKWTNKMLKLRYNSQLYIEKYINGVPQFKIAKIKKKPSLPTLTNVQCISTKQDKAEEAKAMTYLTTQNDIQFPLIYTFFNSPKP